MTNTHNEPAADLAHVKAFQFYLLPFTAEERPDICTAFGYVDWLAAQTIFGEFLPISVQ